MNVLYLPLPDRVPHTAQQQLQHRANHSSDRAFWLRQHRAVMQRFRSNVIDIGPRQSGSEAHRETGTHSRRSEGRPVATFADLHLRAERYAASATEAQSATAAWRHGRPRPQRLRTGRTRGRQCYLLMHAAPCSVPRNDGRRTSTDNHQIEHLQNCYLDARTNLARLLYSVGIGIGKR